MEITDRTMVPLCTGTKYKDKIRNNRKNKSVFKLVEPGLKSRQKKTSYQSAAVTLSTVIMRLDFASKEKKNEDKLKSKNSFTRSSCTEKRNI